MRKNRSARKNTAKQDKRPGASPVYEKNERVVLLIRDIGSGGEGIGFQEQEPDETAAEESGETKAAGSLGIAKTKGIAGDTGGTGNARITDISGAAEDAGMIKAAASAKPGRKRFPVFVKDAVPGDRIEATITKVTSRYAYGHLDRILKPSPDRVEPACPIAKTCGGCQIQALDYRKQLEFKQRKVRENLVRIGGFDPDRIDEVMHPIVGMDRPWHYRNKEQVPVQEGKYGPVTGFYASHSHTVIPMTDCCIGSPRNRQILETILSWMQEYKVPAYDETTGKGLIRHILIRDGIYSGQIMVCVIANDYRLPFEKELVEGLREIDNVTSIVLNTNTDRTNVITGRALRTLWGQDDIEDTLHIFHVSRNGGLTEATEVEAVADTGTFTEADAIKGDVTEGNDLKEETVFEKTEEAVTFSISPLSFYQVNPLQTEKLYSLALDCAGLTGKETVWDLYCGVGTISLFMARHAKKVYGVEIIPEAIENARENARRNGIENAEFYVGKAEEVLPDYVEHLKVQGRDPQIDVICVDPPRKGCDEKCIETMLEIAPKRIVYVSCDPATLARDLKKLAAGGYELEYLQPVDQFGHTVHVEIVCLLTHD